MPIREQPLPPAELLIIDRLWLFIAISRFFRQPCRLRFHAFACRFTPPLLDFAAISYAFAARHAAID
jgi:hypothetical protein